MMPKTVLICLILTISVLAADLGQAQSVMDDFNVDGPWTDLERTTITAPKVPVGTVQLDAQVSSAEYGGFEGVDVIPLENAWVLNYPEDRATDGPEDTSFTFYVTHDEEYLYIGVDVKDDIVNSDNPNEQFWRDDSIEILLDYTEWKFDQNYDSSAPEYGGHIYVNYEGEFSEWDSENGTYNPARTNVNYSRGPVDDQGMTNPTWTYGPNGDVFGVGEEVQGGWVLEVKFSKASLIPPDSDIVLDDGHRMSFNIGVDDDDRHGPGVNGDSSRTEELELQYFWSNRRYAEGWTAAQMQQDIDDGFLTPEDIENRVWLDPVETFYNLIIANDGRLKPGGAGDLILDGTLADITHWSIH
ncbi:MAG: sugar-binding protein [bacterium]